MTIKEFAGLCGCNPQTLRYYDRLDLLKPVKVDEWTGYRYYDEEQALAFVKIKNLQNGGFSIEEIKSLLGADDDTIYEAFSEKIKQQEERLKKTIEISQSYRTEIMTMKKKIKEICDSVKAQMETYDYSAEFGIDKDLYDSITSNVETCFDEFLEKEIPVNVNMPSPEESEALKGQKSRVSKLLKDPNYRLIFEKHDWSCVKDFYNEIPKLEDNGVYALVFQLVPQKRDHITFSNVILNLILKDNQQINKTLNCEVLTSDDGANHFRLLKAM